MNYEIQRAIKQQHPELISIWEKSVRATHHFLSEADIQHYKPLILEQYFNQLDLYSITNENEILGFIGVDGKLIQMLFIDPKGYGLGLGKALVEFAIQSCNINSVDVNEQNEQALGFYKHMGFETVERFGQDSAGKPYPILSMRLKS